MGKTLFFVTLCGLALLQSMCLGDDQETAEEVLNSIDTNIEEASSPEEAEENVESATTEGLDASLLEGTEQNSENTNAEELEDPPSEDEQDYFNVCTLISSEISESTKASFQCEDKSIWLISVEQRGDSCIYQRTIISPTGEINEGETTLDCNYANKWIQEIVQTEVLPGTPDSLLYSTETIGFENTVPIVQD